MGLTLRNRFFGSCVLSVRWPVCKTQPQGHDPTFSTVATHEPIFHVVGLDDAGNVVLRKRCPRGALVPFMAQMPPVVIGMEACGGAHYWARRFRQLGFTAPWDMPASFAFERQQGY